MRYSARTGRVLLLGLALAMAMATACEQPGQTAAGEAEAAPATSAPGGGQAAGVGADNASTTSGPAADPGSGTPSDGGGATSGGGPGLAVADAVTVSDLPPPDQGDPTATDVAPALFDQANDGEIETIQAADRWTFDAQAGQVLAVEVITVDHDCYQDLSLVVETPGGERGLVGWVGNSGCYAYGPILLTETGEHVLEMAGGDGAVLTEPLGAYRFVPYWLTDVDEAPAAPGAPLEGRISQTLGSDRWTFDGEAGQQLTVVVTSVDHDCFQDLTLVLEDPVGDRKDLAWVGNVGCGTPHGPFELPRSGPYVLEFRGGDGGIILETLGAYTFSFTLDPPA